MIGPHVRLGPGTQLHSYVIVEGRTTLGARNVVYHHATLGQPPQDLKYDGSPTELVIGDDNIVREHCTLHLATQADGGPTRIGSGNLLMAGVHIAHDSRIADQCVLSVNVVLGGHVYVHDHAIISGGAAVRHYVSIGRHAMVGGLSGVVHDVPPFMIADGHPARVRAVNRVGLRRRGFSADQIHQLKAACLSLWGRHTRKTDTFASALDAMARDTTSGSLVEELCRFVRATADSGCGRQADPERGAP